MADIRENPIQATLANFSDYGKSLKGDEKGEAQVFCDRLYQAFGHAGVRLADSDLEARRMNYLRKAKETVARAGRESIGNVSIGHILELLKAQSSTG